MVGGGGARTALLAVLLSPFDIALDKVGLPRTMLVGVAFFLFLPGCFLSNRLIVSCFYAHERTHTD